MKNIGLLIIPLLVFLFGGCRSGAYTPDICLERVEMSRTRNLAVSDTMPAFTAVTDGGKMVSLSSIDRNKVFIFFKKTVPKGETKVLFNDEIDNLGIGKLASEKQCDVLITNEAILASIFGIELDSAGNVRHGVLIIGGKDKAIQKIYRGSCEDHIAQLLKDM
jgi:hypothetical protein